MEKPKAATRSRAGGVRRGLDLRLRSQRQRAVFSAARLSTGEIVWQDTSFAPAAVIVVDGKLLILDDSGTLALATPGPTSLTVHARAKILEGPCHAPPTLVEKRVYIRDDQRVVALDLN